MRSDGNRYGSSSSRQCARLFSRCLNRRAKLGNRTLVAGADRSAGDKRNVHAEPNRWAKSSRHNTAVPSRAPAVLDSGWGMLKDEAISTLSSAERGWGEGITGVIV